MIIFIYQGVIRVSFTCITKCTHLFPVVQLENQQINTGKNFTIACNSVFNRLIGLNSPLASARPLCQGITPNSCAHPLFLYLSHDDSYPQSQTFTIASPSHFIFLSYDFNNLFEQSVTRSHGLVIRSNELLIRSNGLLIRSNGLLIRSNGLLNRANGLLIHSNGLAPACIVFFHCPFPGSLLSHFYPISVSVCDLSLFSEGKVKVLQEVYLSYCCRRNHSEKHYFLKCFPRVTIGILWLK